MPDRRNREACFACLRTRPNARANTTRTWPSSRRPRRSIRSLHRSGAPVLVSSYERLTAAEDGALDGGDVVRRDRLVERTHPGQHEPRARSKHVDLAHLGKVDTAAERVALAPILEPEQHGLRHARKRRRRGQAEFEVTAALAHTLEPRRTGHAHVAAFGDEHVRPLERDAP